MNRFYFSVLLAGAGFLGTTLGCGAPEPPPVDVNQTAQAKVDAMKSLADAMSKNPNGLEARAALESFRMNLLDVKANPTESKEIVDIYRQRIKGKYQGEVAMEVQSELAPIESALKKAN